MLKKLFVLVLIILGVKTSVFAETKQEMAGDVDELLANAPGDFVDYTLSVYHQVIYFRYPKGWGVNPVFKNQQGDYFIIEYIPKTQELDTWKDMLTIQGFNGIAKYENSSPEKMMQNYKDMVVSRKKEKCYFKEIYRGDIGGYPGIIFLESVTELPPGLKSKRPIGNGEFSLSLILKGESDIYFIGRAWKLDAPYTENKLPMSEEELEKWLGIFKNIKLISPEEFSKKVAPFKKVEFKKKGE